MWHSIHRTYLALGFLAVGFACLSLSGAETQNKKVLKIHTTSSADGKSNVSKEILEECILELPDATSLVPDVNSTTKFLKGIGGDDNKKDHVKMYTATLDINYMLYQKELIIITTNSVEASEPVREEKERKLQQTITFTANPDNGDMFAGRSRRQYYFSTPEAAAADVKKSAEVWLKQKKAVLCPGK